MKRFVLCMVVGGIACLALGAPAALAAPSNDNFAAAQVVSGSGPFPLEVQSNNFEATRETGEPNHRGTGLTYTHSVWFTFTPTVSREYVLDTCNGVVPVVAGYTGTSITGLTAVARNNTCRVTLDAQAGTTYRIAVDGPSQGGLVLRILARPTNNRFSAAEDLGTSSTADANGSTLLATAETGEPDHSSGAPGPEHSVWYRWTPAAGGDVVVEACNGVNPAVAVYTGSGVSTLTPVGSQESPCRVGLDAAAGTTYRIAVDDHDQAAFALGIHPRPPNDEFGEAVDLTASNPLPTQVAGTTGFAISQQINAGPNSYGPAPMAWYSWQADVTGTVAVDTCGSTNIPIVFEGASQSTLTQISTFRSACSHTFDATSGTTYRIAVIASAEAEFDLTLRPVVPPANDAFDDAQDLTSDNPLPTQVPGTTEFAASQSITAGGNGYGPAPMVWYSWQADVTDTVSVDVCGSTSAPVVFTGNSVGDLTQVSTFAYQTACRSTFDAVSGTVYRIVVMATSAEAPFDLALEPVVRPPNDAFDDAQDLTSDNPLPTQAPGTTEFAASQSITAGGNGYGPAPTVWYSWQADFDGAAAVDTCGSPSLPVVFTGSSVGSLTQVSNPSYQSSCRHTFDVSNGTVYRIVVIATSGEAPFDLNLQTVTRPPNDDFPDAQDLTGSNPLPITASGTTLFASTQSITAGGNGYGPAPMVWYSWQADFDGAAAVDTCGSPSLPVVFTGSSVGSLTQVSTFSSSCSEAFDVTEGIVYRIAVIATTAEGAFDLDLTRIFRPANDDFANAEDLTGLNPLPIQVAGTTEFATREADDDASWSGATVWYSWQPDATGTVALNTCGSTNFPLVYTGSSLASLTQVSNPEETCRSIVDVTAGTTYRIAVLSIGLGYEEDFDLAIDPVNRPANDDFANAEDLTSQNPLPTTVNGTTRYSSGEPGESQSTGNADPAQRSVWYSWTPQFDGTVVFDTCSTGNYPAIAVYTGSSLASLQTVAGRTGACRIELDADSTKTYRIALDSWYVGTDYQLRMTDFLGTPTPVFGVSVVIEEAAGEVTVKTPGSDEFLPVEEAEAVPVGSQVDARDGTFELTSATGPATSSAVAAATATQTASFRGSLYRVTQRKVPGAYTDLKMLGPLGCGGAAGASASAGRGAEAARARVVRYSWGRGKGKFRQSGRKGSGSARGTTWDVSDRCDGKTVIHSIQGTVLARDFVRRRTKVLHTGGRYVAPGPRRRRRR